MTANARELLHGLRAYEHGKLVSADEAVALIQDGDTLATCGFVGIGFAETLALALARRFERTATPQELTLVYAAGQGDGKTRGLNHLGHGDLVKAVVGGHWDLVPRLQELAVGKRSEAWNLPMAREALTLEGLSVAMATHNSGGIVIAQVERLAKRGSLNPRQVKIPGVLVDCAVLAEAPEQHLQTFATPYSPASLLGRGRGGGRGARDRPDHPQHRARRDRRHPRRWAGLRRRRTPRAISTSAASARA